MHQDWQPSASRQTLQARALVLRKIRDWFYRRNILEVETPHLSRGATTDPHIDSFQCADRTLRTSSEFHQKRLLAAGIGDNYELGRVYRIDESGRYHNPEFTMLEWYRCGIDHHGLIDEVSDLLEYLHDASFPGFKKISYRELWQQVADVDIAGATPQTLIDCFTQRGIEVPAATANCTDELLDLGMATFIARSLVPDTYTCIYHYPASQASLARIESTDSSYAYACRFEIFYGSVELANGYYELRDADEQLARFTADNLARAEQGKAPMPIDQQLINALSHGLPDCAGVALGVDRLLMILLEGVTHISDTLSFEWSRA